MSDYISREKYLQDVEHYKNQICYMSNVSMDDCIKICNEQPSIDVRENRWIPVSERLPDNNVLVLCSAISTSISGGYTRFVGCCNNGFWFVQTDAETVSYPRQYKVTAWQPLPEPYQKGNE